MNGVTDIRYVGYAVRNLEDERRFYRDVWKLNEVAEEDGLIYFAAAGAPEHHVVRLRANDDDRIDVIAFAAESREAVEALAGKVADAGCKVVSSPGKLDTPGGGYGFRFFSPDGLPFEISSDVEQRDIQPLNRWDAVPEKISHVVLHSPNHHDLVKFFTDVLGFRVSDWLGDFMCFLRCNEWHHRVAVLPGPPCLNHVAYDMPTLDDMMRGISRVKAGGHDIRWGPGRHTAGNNTFSYFVTPNGFTVEYTSELEKVDEETWEATVHKPTETIMDQWGVGVGGPKTMPDPRPDPGLFQPAGV
ncbi:VOC family protein [Hyphococcus sp.]|uniref:VOC family protein n=1 Tax=Hyphococcus sp. TaxID=2038636 RepID=UPI0035C77B2B